MTTDDQTGVRRVALGSIFQESNDFAGTTTEVDDFAAMRFEVEPTLETLTTGTSEVAGAATVLAAAGIEIVPLLVARASPGGPLSEHCWSRLRDLLVEGIAASGGVDGVVLGLHGAMAVHGGSDPEGELFAQVRETVGAAVPVVSSLDLHAHVTERMVVNTQGLFPYQKYPHEDAFEAGERAATFLLRLLDGTPWPGVTLQKVPVLTAAIRAGTESDGPMAKVAAASRRAAATASEDVHEVSFLHVHPWLTESDMGNGVLVTGGDRAERRELAAQVTDELWRQRFDLEAEVVDPAEALRDRAPGTRVVLVDSADCVGGGAAGDTISVLRAILEGGHRGTAVVPCVDPAAAARCLDVGVGGSVDLEIGHRLDPSWGSPITVHGTVIAAEEDASFVYSGGIYGGTRARMELQPPCPSRPTSRS